MVGDAVGSAERELSRVWAGVWVCGCCHVVLVLSRAAENFSLPWAEMPDARLDWYAAVSNDDCDDLGRICGAGV